MIDVDVCDTSSREGEAALNGLKRTKAKHIIVFSAPESNAVGAMVGKVVDIAAKSSTGMIRRLAIWGHGGSGSQGISRGTDRDSNVQWAGIDLDMLEKEPLVVKNNLRETLGRLWDVLDWNGWVELRGCKVAEGVDGQKFLNILANTWQVPVHAGEVDQRIIVGMTGMERAWTGTVHVARPGVSGTTTFQGQISS